MRIFLLKIFLILILISKTQKINSKIRDLNVEITNSKNQAPGKNDFLRSAVTSSKEIIFGGTSCSHIGINCIIIIQKFSNDFQLIKQVQLPTSCKNAAAGGIIESSDGSIILNTINKLDINSVLIFYKFSPALILEKILSHNKNGNPGITGIINPLEINSNSDSFYRTYFYYKDTTLNSNIQVGLALDINSYFNKTMEPNYLIIANSKQYVSINIYYFGKAGSFFYRSGVCASENSESFNGYICKYDSFLNHICYVNVSNSLYTSIIQKDLQTIYAKRVTFLRESFFDTFSIQGTNIILENEKEIPTLTPYSISDTTG